MSALLKNEATALPSLPRLFYACKCFQNLRQEESRKSVLHALIERIQAYPDRKMEVKFRIGDKTLPPRVDPGNTPYPFCSRYEFQTSSKGKDCD